MHSFGKALVNSSQLPCSLFRSNTLASFNSTSSKLAVLRNTSRVLCSFVSSKKSLLLKEYLRPCFLHHCITDIWWSTREHKEEKTGSLRTFCNSKHKSNLNIQCVKVTHESVNNYTNKKIGKMYQKVYKYDFKILHYSQTLI
jgi:hypothetical protein